MKKSNSRRSHMTLKDLRNIKGQHIARFTTKGNLYEPNTTEPPVSNLSSPGFYFFVHPSRQVVYSRFYVGRQRSGLGLKNIASQLRLKRTQTGKHMLDSFSPFDVYFVSLDKMKSITNGFGKGKIALAFTKQHLSIYQNLEEMNRMLNDNFKFISQKY